MLLEGVRASFRMGRLPMNASVGTGHIKLSDNSVIKLKILIVDVKEVGFSPFGGVQFDVKVVGGISTEFVPEEVKKLVIDKPPVSLSKTQLWPRRLLRALRVSSL